METVNIHEAKTHLSRLVERAARGEPLIIAKAGKPMVKVVPLDTPEPKPKRWVGFMKRDIAVPEDFDTMFADEIEAMFKGRQGDCCSTRVCCCGPPTIRSTCLGPRVV